jgi:DoxX-like protein
MILPEGGGPTFKPLWKGIFMTAISADRSLASSTHEAPAEAAQRAAFSRKAIWTGRVLTGLAAAFLAFDATLKLSMVPEAVAGTAELGWPASVIPGLGVLQLILLAVYLVPRTAVLGAVLWTGYLGGAIATHLRIGHPWLSHTLFPIYVAVLIWGGLWLRDRRVRALLAR